MPRLIVQPIVENAFKHSFEKKWSNGLICISFETNQNELWIIVEDNGEDLTDTEKVIKPVEDAIKEIEKGIKIEDLIYKAKELLGKENVKINEVG